MNSQNDTLGLYVSIPFCRHKCSFCNFASGISTSATIDRYVGQLIAEIHSSRATTSLLGAKLPNQADTLYFGGGTPSLLTPSQLQKIFAALRQTFDLSPTAEITLEAAPDQIPADLLEAAQREGINRISLGVQSFVDREAAAVGRTHTAASCLAEIACLQAASIPDIGVDLIAGLPYQTLDSWQHSLDIATQANLTHLSVYMLEVDEDSRLGREVLNQGPRFHAPSVLADEAAAALYDTASSHLPAHGFEHYEISNFSRPGFASRHNRKYWTRVPYLGLGLDAHSMLNTATNEQLRFANTDDLTTYNIAPTRTAPQRIDAQAALEESIFLGLRLTSGIPLATLDPRLHANLDDLLSANLLDRTATHLRLTPRGRLLSNEVFGRLLEPIAA